MAMSEMDFIGGGGNEPLEYTWNSQTWSGGQPITITTTKKAKGLVFYLSLDGSDHYVYICTDGYNGNKIYRNGSDWGLTMTFNDNSIVSSGQATGSSITIYYYIIY